MRVGAVRGRHGAAIGSPEKLRGGPTWGPVGWAALGRDWWCRAGGGSGGRQVGADSAKLPAAATAGPGFGVGRGRQKNAKPAGVTPITEVDTSARWVFRKLPTPASPYTHNSMPGINFLVGPVRSFCPPLPTPAVRSEEWHGDFRGTTWAYVSYSTPFPTPIAGSLSSSSSEPLYCPFVYTDK
jgi:hypothetical protein